MGKNRKYIVYDMVPVTLRRQCVLTLSTRIRG